MANGKGLTGRIVAASIGGMENTDDGDNRQQEQDEQQQLAESLRIAAYVDASLKSGEYGRAGFRYSDAGEVSPDGRNITAFNQAQNRAIQERKERNRK